MNEQTKEGENCTKNKSSNCTNQNLVELRWAKIDKYSQKLTIIEVIIIETKHANVNIERPKRGQNIVRAPL